MKIGINNIFTSFWFFTMFLCGGALTYMAIDRNIITSDLILIGKVVIAFIIFVSIGIFVYFFYKFRILIINHHRLLSIHPFLFKKEQIELANIKKVKLENWISQNGITYRQVSLKDTTTQITFTDREFENFDTLIHTISITENQKQEVDFNQAKSNISNVNFNIFSLSGFLMFLIFNTWNSGFHSIMLAFMISNGLLLFASVKRKLKYSRIIKLGKLENIEND